MVIAGATAVGKTDLAIRLALQYKTVVLSADSRQFYREMNIGTAKPSPEQLRSVPHFFIDTHSVDQLYGAGHYARDAKALLADLFKKQDVVIVTGGSGLYIEVLLDGVDEFEETENEVRTQIIAEYKQNGLAWLQNEVKTCDPDFYKNADTQNPQRLMRALEVWRQSKKSYSSFLNKKKSDRDFTDIRILVNLPRELLYERINKRVDDMMLSGLLEEVKNLKAHMHLNALKTVGYRELSEYLNGERSLENAVDKIKQHTRNYAKRQLTWFRNRGNYREFDIRHETEIKTFIASHIH